MGECCLIEHVQFKRQLIEGEVFVDDIARGEQAVPAHVAFIVEVFFVVAQYTPLLF